MITRKGDGTIIHHKLDKEWKKEKPYRSLALRKFLNKWFRAHLPTIRTIEYKEWEDGSSMSSESYSGYGEY